MEQHRSMGSVTKFGVLKTSLQATRTTVSADNCQIGQLSDNWILSD